MRLAIAMMQALALQADFAEERAHRKVAVAFAVPPLARIRAPLLRCYKATDLTFDHDLLNVPEDGFAFGQTQTQRLWREFVPCQRSDLAHFLLPVFGDRNDFNLE